MEVQLLSTTSENNTIGKKYSSVATISATLKDNSSIIHPVLIFNFSGDIYDMNYMYIPEWKRYYYIRDIVLLTGGRYQIAADCDVLESFKADILKMSVVLDGTESTGSNKYLPSPVFIPNIKNSTDIIEFPSGLLETGEFILITAGG